MIVTSDPPPKPKSASGQTTPPTESPPTYAESSPLASTMNHPTRYREPAGKRFVEALIVALCIWVGFGIITSGISVQVRRSYGRDWDIYPGEAARPLPSDGAVDLCVSGNKWTFDDRPPNSDKYMYSAHHAFKLPANSRSLEFFSRGSFSSGSIDFAVSSSKSADIDVQVTVLYRNEHALNQASVCTIHREEKESGLGIFTPTQKHGNDGHHYYDSLRFTVEVQIPVDHLDKLSTNLSLFEHTLRDFANHLDVEVVSLRSSNAGINIESLRAHKVDLKTSNGKIELGRLSAETFDIGTSNAEVRGDDVRVQAGVARSSNGGITGTFYSSSKLHLITSNAKIDAEIFLNNTKGASPSDLVLKTSNGPVHGRVHLIESESNQTLKSVSSYKVAADTSNSLLEVQILTSPLDSVLDLRASTSNSPATVHLDSAYEGSYLLTSSYLAPVFEDTHAKDPSKNKRERVIEQNSIGRGVLKGLIYWKGTDKVAEKGSVQLSTSNSRARLVV